MKKQIVGTVLFVTVLLTTGLASGTWRQTEDKRDIRAQSITSSLPRTTRRESELFGHEKGGAQAFCLMRIHCQPEILPLEADPLSTLLNSPSVKLRIREELGAEGLHFEVALLSGSPFRGPLFQLDLFGDVSDEVAGEIFKVVADRLDKTLDEEYARAIGMLEEQRARMKEAQTQSEQQLIILKKQARKLRDEAGVSDLSRDKILDRARDLEEDRQNLEIEQVGLQARKEAIQKELAQRAGMNADRAANDNIRQELREILKLREEKAASGLTADKKIEAREELVHARIELARREEALAGAGGEMLAAMSSQLSELAIQSAQIEAQLKYVGRQRDRHRSLLDLADKYDLDTMKLNMELAERSYRRMSERLQDLKEHRIQMTEPSVSLVGGE